MPSAQVKSAIVLAALPAEGTTVVRESVATRDHTERMLRARGVRSERTASPATAGRVVEIEGRRTVQPLDERVPGDPSAAAFWLVAGAIHPDADLTVRGVGVNPRRRAVIDLLIRMGAAIEEMPIGPAPLPATASRWRTSACEARACSRPPAHVARRLAAAIDEIPVLCLAATQARGRSVIRGAGELRHKESDRIAGIVDGPACTRCENRVSTATTSSSMARPRSVARRSTAWGTIDSR